MSDAATVPSPDSQQTALIPKPSDPRARAIRRSNRARAIRVGNANALKHGVFSDVAIREDVRDECAVLFARAPWLEEVRDGPLVESTARLIVRLRRLDLAIEAAIAEWATRAEPRASTQALTTLAARLEGQLTRNLEALGLSPRAAAALGLVKLDAAERARRMADRALDPYRNGGSR